MAAEQKFDPGSFHFLTAGFVKDLLAARVRTDPDFVVSPEMRKRWKLDADETKSYTTERLLRRSRERFNEICNWRINRIGSSGRFKTEEEIVSDVHCDVKIFINREALDNAISAEKNGQPIDWENGFHWDELDKIREGLDLLPHPPDQPAKRELPEVWLAQAMLLVRDNPGWSDAKIARRVGKNKSTLSRSTEYQNAAAMARGEKDNRKRGHITVDPESGLQDVEAYSDDPAERDWDQ